MIYATCKKPFRTVNIGEQVEIKEITHYVGQTKVSGYLIAGQSRDQIIYPDEFVEHFEENLHTAIQKSYLVRNHLINHTTRKH
ncbi:hypothetical protein [Pseudoalteromonas luteoviolacea]|uniref:hypothetical protein n=1 Tax=Pseudoalteromonas luteoviolacea TaxID=43657 RepID=UPI001B370DD7|nr:hypothetical protein [Pseudoalteromonas luteoviolacea]MBQ4839781.1 hypothetical protein [Pseudoalteromonas luteoviolacea]